MTIIAMALVTAPIALPTALVRRPTLPSSWPPRFAAGPRGTMPSEAANAITRSNWAVTTCAQRLELRGDGRAGEPEDPADEAEPDDQVSSSRQPRRIGR